MAINITNLNANNTECRTLKVNGIDMAENLELLTHLSEMQTAINNRLAFNEIMELTDEQIQNVFASLKIMDANGEEF